MPDTVPASYAQAALRLFVGARAEIESLVRDLGLPPALLDARAATGSVGAEQFGQLFMALVRLSQRQLQPDAESARDVQSLSTYRLMFAYMRQAANLREAIERAALFFLRFNDRRQSFRLEVGDLVAWRFALPRPDEEGERAQLQHFGMGKLNWLPGEHGRLAALYIWHRLASWLIGSFVELESVTIDLPRRRSAAGVNAAFRCGVLFGQPGCSLRFHPRYLAFPVIRSEAELDAMLATFPAELLRIDAGLESVSARVRALLGGDFSRELPGLEEIAGRLHMTVPTLHRRLLAEGASFRKIKDHCRRDAALALLRDSELGGAELAERLGFSDASTFLRAFRKWTGCTPGEFRRAERLERG